MSLPAIILSLPFAIASLAHEQPAAPALQPTIQTECYISSTFFDRGLNTAPLLVQDKVCMAKPVNAVLKV